ncbi:MAG: transcription-repair coupling factor [Kouleothrix sp.]|nr:transcription-repair coupling factor [Kouleothrix sp.]
MASDLEALLHQLSRHERIAALASELRERPGARLHVAPALTAARPALAAALATLLDRPLLYLVSSGEAALRAREDLCQWLGPDAVLLFPAGDALPYEPMSPGNDVIAGRLGVLRTLNAERRTMKNLSDGDSALSAQRSALVVVAPIKALLQPTLTPAEYAEASVLLRRGDEHSPDELIARWVAMGYRAAPTVEEPGELNRRGGIVDIFPPGADMPLRIEFFGDEIDSLRRFDPITQRSEAQAREAVVGPPHEIPLWRRDLALRRLRALDTAGMRAEARDELAATIERIAQGERFEGRALFAPFFFNDERRTMNDEQQPSSFIVQHSSLLEHLPPGTPVVFSEQILLAQHAAELHHHAEERRRRHVEAGELPPDFPRPYLLWDELLAQAGAAPLVNLSNNDQVIGDRGQGTGDRGQGSDAYNLPPAPYALPPALFVVADLFGGQLKRLVDDIVARLRDGERVVLVTPQAARIQEMVDETLNAKRRTMNEMQEETFSVQRSTFSVEEMAEETLNAERRTMNKTGDQAFSIQRSAFIAVHGSLDEGWRSPELGLTLYSDTEIFGWRQRRPVAERKRKRDRNAEERAAFLRGLKVGDHVVHIEHGIAVYEGLIRRTVGKTEREYLNLRYAEGDRLYVPVDQIDRVSRYIGAGDAAPQLTRLGTQEWERAKRRARAAVQELAQDLLELYAKRQLSQGHAFGPDTEWQRELEDAFPYVETVDQLHAIADVKQDMELVQPMDRLICGDVGFGKTEVALRAAFKAIQDGKQVAVLVPTTVLAQQHFETFSRRLAAFPVKVDMISRFRSAKEQDVILARLARGEIDIIIGTHRLLSKDIHFKDLGLLIVDEEQRFGVRHKERIKQIRANVDVLTLTATPIPRTLHMALAGIRDLSVIDTPPEDRVPIKTYVLPYDEQLIRESILRELDRGGQIYYVHNRVQSIYYVAEKLRLLVPEAEIGVGHGQLEEHQLEKVMLDFFSGKDDVLVCTTIIESGLDVPNANTLIIDDATNYGLAQLYQLRGRVGRSAQRAYAYLFYKGDHRMTAEAQERLQAIQEATELGAGFRIAMRDLEIRGAGNLLGAEQSGHIAAVGFDLYSRLLEQAVRSMKAHLVETNFKLPVQEDKETKRQDAKETIEANADQPDSLSPGLPASLAKRRQPQIKVDEKVLISPLVTLDLPLDAYLPPEYIPDDRVRLSVYQHMAEAQTPRQVRDLRQELQDRFGKLPDPADALLIWLQIKALALSAGITSIVTTPEEFIVRLPEGTALDREKLRRRFGRDPAVRVGPQFVRLDRRSLGDGKWIDSLTGVLETLAK